jgi:hypothetical protein
MTSGFTKLKPNSDTIIDMTDRNKRYKTGICYSCDHSKYPNGKVIDPTTDKYSRQLEGGEWVCGTCIAQENAKLLSLFSRGRKD